MEPRLLFGPLGSGLAWALFGLTWRRYRARPSWHNGLYALGLFLFALAVSLEALARLLGGWTPGAYRLWYLAGAMHGVSFLGLGSLALLSPRAARSTLLALLPLILFGLYLVLTAPLDLARLPEPSAPTGAAFPPPGPTSPRLWTIPFNLLGTALLLGVALYSTFRFLRSNPLRAYGTLLIAFAALVLASVSTLNRLGVAGLEEAGRMLGAGLLYLGVALADRATGYAGGRA